MADRSIVVYALSTCSHCKSARKFLADHGIQYQSCEVDMLSGEERTKAIEELIRHNPDRSFPTIVIDGGARVVVGFREDKLKEALDIS